jgi:hypothetical protein
MPAFPLRRQTPPTAITSDVEPESTFVRSQQQRVHISPGLFQAENWAIFKRKNKFSSETKRLRESQFDPHVAIR